MAQTESEAPQRPSETPNAAQPVEAAAEECHPTCTIASQTFKTSPTDRTRTKVGVGEEVTITVTGNPATWEIDTGGTITPTGGTTNSVTFTAGGTAATATIQATGSGCSCVNTIVFTVVEPESMTMRRKGSTNEHNNPQPDCGWTGLIYVHPNDVNFYRVQVRELDSQAVCAGCYNVAPFPGAYHGGYPLPDRASPWLGMSSHSETRGSKVNGEDHVYSGYPPSASVGTAPPFTTGNYYWPMTWQWRVRGVWTRHNFPRFRQTHRIDAAGRCTSSKAGHSESCLYSDPTSARA